MIYAFGSVVYPAVATIKSSKCPPDEQGRVLGALNGILLRGILMSTWGFLPAVFRPLWTVFPGLGAVFLNLGGKMEGTAKKWGKNGKRWARNGLKRVGAS